VCRTFEMTHVNFKRSITEMYILGTTNLQHEGGMYLAETLSCVNKENRCARLEIVYESILITNFYHQQ